MGNCLRRESAMVWAGGDDDTCQLQKPHHDHDDHSNNISACNPERQIRAANSSSNHSLCSSSSRAVGQQVKIKISKKELEELVGSRGDICMEGLSSSSVEQLLARLIIIRNNNNIHDPDHHHDQYYDQMEDQQSWRPALQSIPELN